VIKTFVLIYK